MKILARTWVPIPPERRFFFIPCLPIFFSESISLPRNPQSEKSLTPPPARDSAASPSCARGCHRRRPTPPRNSPTPDPNADQLLHPPPCLILLFPHRLRRPSPPPPSIAASAVAPLDLFFPHSAHPHLSHHPPGWGILHLQAFLYPPRLHWYLCFFFIFFSLVPSSFVRCNEDSVSVSYNVLDFDDLQVVPTQPYPFTVFFVQRVIWSSRS